MSINRPKEHLIAKFCCFVVCAFLAIMAQKRKRSINYSHLPDATSISHGDLYVALQNISVYKSLKQALQRENKSVKQYYSSSEVFTVGINNTILLDSKYDRSGNYRKCLLPMPGWIYFPQNINNSISYGLVSIQVQTNQKTKKNYINIINTI